MMVSNDHDADALQSGFEENVIGEFFEVRAPKPGWIKVMTLGKSSDGFKGGIHFVPEPGHKLLGNDLILGGDAPGIFHGLRVENQIHWQESKSSTGSLEFGQGQAADFS
jgi:hypothetical protein